MLRAAATALGLMATTVPGQDSRPAVSPAAETLLAGLHWPLPARLDRIPLLCPDDVPAALPFTVRLGARLYRTDLEDVEAYEPGTEVLPPWPGEASTRRGDTLHQTLVAAGGVRLTLTGLDAATGRLRAEGPCPDCDPRLRELGYLPGPHLLLRIDGLFPDTPAGQARFRRFALERLLPSLASAPSARPASRPARWAPPSERTLDGYARALLTGGLARTRAPAVQAEPTISERLGFFRVAAGAERRVPEAGPVFERLVARFLAGLRWPFPDAPGLVRFAGEDDQYGRAGAFPHHALDLGARLRAADGRIHLWPGNAPCYPLHAELPAHTGEILLQDAEHVLRVELQAFHLQPSRGQDGAIGVLEPFEDHQPFGGWRTSDPYLRLLGVPKGNHLHVLVRGIFTQDEDRRAAFLREAVMPAWLMATGPAASLRTAPLPEPAAGSGADEDQDPRGAAVLRAQLRLLTRCFQPLGPDAVTVALDPPSLEAEGGEVVVAVTTRAEAQLLPPVRDVRLGRKEGDWCQEVTVTAGGRTLTVQVRIRGAEPAAAGLRATAARVELRLPKSFPHARAWAVAWLLPVLRGEGGAPQRPGG